MNRVLVVDTDKKPCDPVHPGEARLLLSQGEAAVFRRYPFTIILGEARAEEPRPLRLKIDPGSKATGIVLVEEESGRVVFAAEIEHRGQRIKQALADRRSLRRNRRSRKTRHRKPRFDNRTRPKGWLPPSLESRVANVETWVARRCRLAPVKALSLELVKFDTQAMQNPEAQGVEYQRGELCGFELREYLLEKFYHRCAYCGAENVPLEVEHIIPKSRGGTSRASNLCTACRRCNQAKGDRTAEEFGHPEVQAQAKAPLKDAAAVNATRWALYHRLQRTGLPIECGSGGRTKYNRTRQGYPKAHWIDAACVGETGARVRLQSEGGHLVVKACGHGKRQRCVTDKYGFPKAHAPKSKRYLGFQTGDIVRAEIPAGKFKGTHTGRVAIRYRPCFRLGAVDVHPKHLMVLQRSDGYAYA